MWKKMILGVIALVLLGMMTKIITHSNKQETVNQNLIKQLGSMTNEVGRVQSMVLQKKDFTGEIISSLYESVETEVEIIRNEIEEKNIANDFPLAILNTQIKYSLMTIQRKWAYLRKLSEFYNKLDNGNVELEYIKDRIMIDMNVAELMDADVEKLINEIEKVIQDNTLDFPEDIMAITEQDKPDLEDIWRQIVSEKKKSRKAWYYYIPTKNNSPQGEKYGTDGRGRTEKKR